MGADLVIFVGPISSDTFSLALLSSQDFTIQETCPHGVTNSNRGSGTAVVASGNFSLAFPFAGVGIAIGNEKRLSIREASQKPQGFSPQMKAQKQKRINLYSVKGAWRFDQSIQSKIIALAFSMAAEIERDLISQRTKEALRFKKAQGMKLGRPTAPAKRKLDPYRPEIENLLPNDSTQRLSPVATTQ